MRQRFDQHDLADFARVDALLGRHESGIEPPHEADLQLDPRRFGRRDHLVAFPGVGRHGLFAQDVFAGLRGRDDNRPVKRGRSRHDDGVDPRIGQGLGVVGVGRVQLQFLASLLASLRDRLDQGDQARAGHAAGRKIPGVDHARSSTADDTDTQHGRTQPRVCRLPLLLNDVEG